MRTIGPRAIRTSRNLADQARAMIQTSGAESSRVGVLMTWDATWEAFGHAHTDPARGARVLEAVFTGQWANGMLPHASARGAVPAFTELWHSRRSPHAPRHRSTSGIVHPPLQATAALRIGTALGTTGRAFLAGLYPRLAAWHDYLLTSRTRAYGPLVEVWHPWETGMDASPMWDTPLAAAAAPAEGTPLSINLRPSELDGARPTRTCGLLEHARDAGYDPAHLRRTSRFAVHDVLFNSTLVRAELDLGVIAQRLGIDGERHLSRSRRLASAMNRELFDPSRAWFVDRDLRGDRTLAIVSATQLTPLYAGIPDPGRAALLVDLWRVMSAGHRSPLHGLMPSADPTQAEFSPTTAWRGSAWLCVNWMLHEGLRAYGYEADASLMRDTLLTTVRREGFWDHYGWLGGRGCGRRDAAPTAALTLDLLAAELEEPEAA